MDFYLSSESIELEIKLDVSTSDESWFGRIDSEWIN